MDCEFGLIAADTSRTRAYLAAMWRHAVMPSWILLLESNASDPIPGQAGANFPKNINDKAWPEADFDPSAPIRLLLDRYGCRYTVSGSSDINHPTVIALIAQAETELLVYSGYGGVILREPVLATGKRFLHVHGGYLPNFKGSTTQYYSLLAEGSIGASSIFMTTEIDGGPVIRRQRFAPPAIRIDIDHVYDSAARARVLIDTLKAWRISREWTFELLANSFGKTHYIIHPVLKHIAILGGSKVSQGT